MSEHKKIIYGPEAVDATAQLLKNEFARCSVFTFTGPLGVGKTTLIRAILKLSGVKEQVTSPTFTYVNMYHNHAGHTLYHFDCYRIKTLDEFLEAGFGEYLYAPRSWSFIEWPSLVFPLLYHRVCHVKLDYGTHEQRELTYSVTSPAEHDVDTFYKGFDND